MPARDRRIEWLVRALVLVSGLCLCLCLLACRRGHGNDAAPAPSASAGPLGLSAELSQRVLAKVGDRTITLGEYAAVLDRMDRFERLRYQTPDRRKQLLDEMIDVELLAREAERRGLAERPETKELVRQILRDEVLRRLRDGQPSLEDIPAAEVRAYYDAHHADFKEPERRRISHIVVKDRKSAEQILAEAEAATPKQWGDLVSKRSLDKPPGDAPPELSGDLGFVTPPSFGKNDNARVPESVRAAAFEIGTVGAVLGRVVEAGTEFHVVRLVAKNDPRDRSLDEADRTIRVRLVQDRLHKAEDDLERELRTRYPVQVDDAALGKVRMPDVGNKP